MYFIKEQINYRTGPQDSNEKGIYLVIFSINKFKNSFKTPLKIELQESNYIYLDSYEQTKAYANAILISPQILTNSTEIKCLKFRYHMFSYPLLKLDAPLIGSLAIKLRV